VDIEYIKSLIRDVPDFPKPGIVFKDITPLLASSTGLRRTAELMAEAIRASGAQELVGIESRGFLFGAAIAAVANMPLHLVRKPGKLPYTTVGQEYQLEYGSDRVEIHTDAIEPGRRYAVIDDLIATGGTAAASIQLVQGQGGEVVCASFVIELALLCGRDKLGDCSVHSLIQY
jgi:adenine phosphoribosyltransferase